ncbi:purine-nucleoside phosphorylase [bacterium]|nr:purine-nucleoside phosphorylase [bacterium]
MRETNDPGIRAAHDYVAERIPETPRLGLILGSGLGSFADEVSNPVVIPTGEIPGYPVSTVPGHAGRLVFGRIDDVPVVVVQGRVHFYEGYPMEQVVMPARLVAALGVTVLVVTNASGAMGDHLDPGDLMSITDHINMMGTNPLIGQTWGFDRFPDMSMAYHPELRKRLHAVAEQEGIKLKEGVLGGFMGPTYETSAEVRFLKSIGADAACMSTIPEVIASARLKLPVVGVSCITNKATGISPTPLTHEEVTETAAKVEMKFRRLLRAAVPELAKELAR